jgi:hypothetical protein
MHKETGKVQPASSALKKHALQPIITLSGWRIMPRPFHVSFLVAHVILPGSVLCFPVIW